MCKFPNIIIITFTTITTHIITHHITNNRLQIYNKSKIKYRQPAPFFSLISTLIIIHIIYHPQGELSVIFNIIIHLNINSKHYSFTILSPNQYQKQSTKQKAKTKVVSEKDIIYNSDACHAFYNFNFNFVIQKEPNL